MNINELKSKFESRHVTIQAGCGGLPVVKIANAAATAEICLLGAHVMSYIPAGQQDVLWMSSEAIFAEGTALRGGIPVCWPWFSKHPDIPEGPTHGCVRQWLWDIDSVCDGDDDSTRVTFALSDNAHSRAHWPYAFDVKLEVTIGNALELKLIQHNTDSRSVVLSNALHTYFNIGDVSRIRIEGFDGLQYVNKVGEIRTETRHGDIVIDREVDEVYQNCATPAYIHDAVFGRTIVIEKSGSQSAVVWNPWIAKSQRMSDFPNDGYKTMVCVETANAMDNAFELAPGETATLYTKIYVK